MNRNPIRTGDSNKDGGEKGFKLKGTTGVWQKKYKIYAM